MDWRRTYKPALADVQSVRPHLGHISENGWPNTDVRDVTGTPFVPEHHRVSVVVEEDQMDLLGVVGPVNAVPGRRPPRYPGGLRSAPGRWVPECRASCIFSPDPFLRDPSRRPAA